jgi:hypothetical protein
MLGINLKVGVEATLQRLNAHSKGRQFKDLKFVWGYPTAAISEYDGKVTIYLPHVDEAKAVPDGLLAPPCGLRSAMSWVTTGSPPAGFGTMPQVMTNSCTA